MEEQKEESPKRPKGRQKKDLGRRTSREKTSELNLEKFKGSKEDEYDMLIHAIRNPRDSHLSIRNGKQQSRTSRK
eukprot:scaffold15270_cov41-Cylindrotheca_fusiformis.AAC.1